MDKLKTFLLIFLICFSAVFSNSAQELSTASVTNSDEITRFSTLNDYAERLNELRTNLAGEQKNYINSLLKFSNENVSIRIDHLRGNLKEALLKLVENGTSSESILALNRANVEYIKGVIQTYETFLGETTGIHTTEWNVLTANDLRFLSEQTQTQLKNLENAILIYSEPAIKPPLLMRKTELESWCNCIKKELELRINSESRKLIQISKNLSKEYLNEIKPYIEMVDGSGKEEFFLRKLRLQAELRLHRSPSDAALSRLKELLPIEPPSRTILPGTPTLTNPTGNKPPTAWENPIQGVIDKIRDGCKLELDSIQMRDPIGFAEARSTNNVYCRWMQIALRDNKVLIPQPFSFIDSTDLIELQEGYTKWLFELEKEKIANLGNSRVEFEYKEALSKIDKIKKELANRHFIPNDPPQLKKLSNISQMHTSVKDVYFDTVMKRGPPPDELFAFEKKMETLKNHFKAVELRKALDRVQIIPDQALKRDYTNTIKELKGIKKDLLLYAKGKNGQQAIQAMKDIQFRIVSQKKLTNPGFRILGEEIKSTHNMLRQIQKSSELFLYSQPKVITVKTGEKFLNKIKINPGIRLEKNFMPYERYSTQFPVKKWVMNYKSLISDVRLAPGGVIIDFTLSEEFMRKVKKVYFDIFSGRIFILVNENWKPVEPLVPVSTLRQAWGFVTDGRVAAVDIRMLSAQEQEWLLEPIAQSKEVLTENSLKNEFLALRDITVVNLHPAFVDTKIGRDLILADQVIFDLLPKSLTRLEGENIWVNIDITDLFNAFKKDFFLSFIDLPSNQRSILKSIVLIKSGNACYTTKSIQIVPKIEFKIYKIPDYESDAAYSEMIHSSKWFNKNELLLSQKIEVLKEIVNIASYVGLFKSIKKHRIVNNFDDLTFTQAEFYPTPLYLYSGNDLTKISQLLKQK